MAVVYAWSRAALGHSGCGVEPRGGALTGGEVTMEAPEVRYAKSGDVHIAYQVVGNGPIDLVEVPGWVSHLEHSWEEPSLARFLQRLASFARLIRFDKRGTGLSDRVAETALPALEQRMDDVRAVMDAVGSERAALFGISEGGPMSILFAATYPERTSALILYAAYAWRGWSPEHPWAAPKHRLKCSSKRPWRTGAGWRTSVSAAQVAPPTRTSSDGSRPTGA